MKKIIITLMFTFPLLAGAQTVQEQYESALRQVIALLQQQVEMLIAQLNTMNAQIQTVTPTYTYTPITSGVSVTVPEPTVVPVTSIPVPTVSIVSTPIPTLTVIPNYTIVKLIESENVANYSLKSATSSSLDFKTVTVKVAPKTVVNTYAKVALQVWFDNNMVSPSDVVNGTQISTFVINKPENETSITIPIDLPKFSSVVMGYKTVQVRVEISAYGVGNPNDRYTIVLDSIE